MANSMGLVVSLAEMEQFYRGDKAGQIIELMNKTNDIMDDVLWMDPTRATVTSPESAPACPMFTGADSTRARRLPNRSGARSRKAAASLRPSWNWMWKRSACTATVTAPSA